MKVLIVNRFFGSAQIPTGRMAEDLARLLVESGHEVTALASSGEYVGAVAQAQHGAGKGGVSVGQYFGETVRTEIPDDRTTATPGPPGTLRVETVRVPKWMPRALAWLWFTWQARERIPRMDWDVCVLMTDPPLLPLLAARAKAAELSAYATAAAPDSGVTTKRQVAVWLMDLYPEALAASGRITKSNPLYKWYFSKRQHSLAAADLLICLGETQRERLKTKRRKDQEHGEVEARRQGAGDRGQAVGTATLQHCNTEPLGGELTDKVRTAVVPPWDDRGNIALATEGSLRNLALYAGNLGEAHCFEEILAAAPYLPGDWTIRFAARGAKLDALRAKARNLSHGFTRINTDRVRTAALTGRGEKLVPDDLGTRKSSSDEKAADTKGHSRPEGDRQLEELSEVVKSTRINTDGVRAVASTGLGGSAHTKVTLSARNASSDQEIAEVQEGAASLLASSSFGLFSSLGAKIEITGYASEEETPRLLASARVHLITMSPGWEGIVVPSKLYGCIRTGRPVLFIGPENADTAREIRANDWGKVLPPGTSGEEVASAILELAARETRAPQLQQGAAKVAQLIQSLATDERQDKSARRCRAD